jgi:hypothetical protein
MLKSRSYLVRRQRFSHFRFGGRHLDFQLPIWSHSIATGSVGLLYLKHTAIAVKITWLYSPEADIRTSGLEAAILNFQLPV